MHRCVNNNHVCIAFHVLHFVESVSARQCMETELLIGRVINWSTAESPTAALQICMSCTSNGLQHQRLGKLFISSLTLEHVHDTQMHSSCVQYT